MSPASIRSVIMLAALLPSLASCAGIIGLEQAEHDEKLDKAAAGGSGNGTGGGGGGNKTPCDRYCDTVMTQCLGDHVVYFSKKLCQSVCATLPPGAPGDVSGNTVECRLHFAQSVESAGEPELNCPAAGPGGDGVCGDNCQGFCTIALTACPKSPVTGATCVTSCGALRDRGGYTSKITEGNSVQCRLYHASAATIDPDQHCAHVAGIGPCSPSSVDTPTP